MLDLVPFARARRIVTDREGVVASVGTPRPIIERLNTAIARHNKSPDLRQQLLQMYFAPRGNEGSAADFSLFLKRQLARWSKAVRESGAKPN